MSSSSPLAAVASAVISLSLLLVGCKGDSPASTGELEASAVAAPATKTPSVWYDETRPLYNKIPVTVRFTPRNDKAAEAAWRYLESIDDTFNSYRADSEVGALNRRADVSRPIAVSVEMASALAFSRELYDQTDGAFDITVAPLIRLWSQAAKLDALPTDEALDEARSYVGLDVVSVNSGMLEITGGRPRAFDFGGVIKGVAADRAARLLEASGATSVFVQVGNETVAFGPSPSRRPTLLAIEDPRGGGRPFAAIADPGTGLSATTSSNSKQPRIIGGVRYYHIVDPRSGKPASTHVLSATVVFTEPGRAGLADGLATAITVLGPERGLEIVEAAGGEALILTGGESTIERHQTPGFHRLLASP